MKIMCLTKVTCLLENGITPESIVPTLRGAWVENFLKYSAPHRFVKSDPFYKQTQQTPGIPPDLILLFDSEEDLNTWANNCRLTDPQLIADQEIWKTAHGITFTYEYYSLSPTTGPDPVV